MEPHSEDTHAPAALPREIDPAQTFASLVDWIHDELIVKRGAPGFVIGLSGTDSVVAYLACAEAFKRAGRPDRVVGVHYGEKDSKPQPSLEEIAAGTCGMVYDPWFRDEIIPWLKQKAPEAKLIIDDSIDHRSDSHRWAALMDRSIIREPIRGSMLPEGQNYWVIGTRNRTEQTLGTYSNISRLASAQPLDALWKSEVLKICHYLGVPTIAMVRAREADCVCGRFTEHAVNIEESDALLMVRKGELSPSYVQDNMPARLRETLEHFIDDQLKRSGFKEEIPYRPDLNMVSASRSDDRAITEAKKSALLGGDVKAISAVVPELIRRGQANAACDLVCTTAKDRSAWLPEALTLFKTPGLRISQRRAMLDHIFGKGDLRMPETMKISNLCSKIGDLGFSFPRWRYLTQRAGSEPSLVEHFGMERLMRDTDIRNVKLPDPDRDELGTGFVSKDREWYVELRRSYIVCSHLSEKEPATIVIRNNSHYYGRDRLGAAAYVSFESLTPAQLQDMTPQMLESHFTPWQDIIRDTDKATLKERLARIEAPLEHFNRFEQQLDRWLQSETGAKHLLAFLEHKASTTKPIYIGGKEAHAAPWFPRTATAVTPQLVHELKEADDQGCLPDAIAALLGVNSELVLLTGKNGDLPAKFSRGVELNN